jgi:zinc transport system permease protein
MIDAVVEGLRFGFMRHALAAGLLVSVACGIVGTLIVVKRLVFVSGGVAHAAYGGIGLGYLLGISPVLGAILFSLAAAVGMGAIQRKTGERADTLIGVTWAIGMALGIVFVDLARGYKADLMSYLFGSLLAVPAADLLMMLILDVVVVSVVVLFYKELLAVTFDEVFATVERVPVTIIYLLLMAMVGLTVVMLMRVVGLILVIAIFMTVGLWLSYFLNLTSGATIILFSGLAYLISLALHSFTQRHDVLGGSDAF